MEKENSNLIMVVSFILLLFLISQFQSLSIINSNYQKEISYNEINAIAKSTREFGENTVQRGGYHNLAENYLTDVSDDKFRINLNSYSSGDDHRVGTPLGKTDTYIETINLNFTTKDLKKLNILFTQENHKSCQDGDTSGQIGGKSSITLIGKESIILFESESPTTYHNPSTSKSGQIIITKDDEDFLINLMGNTELLDIPEGNYELKISANLIPCWDGGSNKEKIEITNLVLEKEVITPPPIPHPQLETNWLLIIGGLAGIIVVGYFINKS